MSGPAPRGPPMKTCPNCHSRQYPALRVCRTPGCGWNFMLRQVGEGGKANPANLAAHAASVASRNSASSSRAEPRSSSTYVRRAAQPITAAGGVVSRTYAVSDLGIGVNQGPPGSVSSRVSSSGGSGRVNSYSGIDPEDDGNMETCVICGDLGTLICCDICPLSFHADCAGLEHVPQGFWSCPQCSAKSLGGSNQAAPANMSPTAAGRHVKKEGGGESNGGGGTVGLVGLQTGLDAFHHRLNARLDHSAAETHNIDGYTFMSFPPPNTNKEGESTPKQTTPSPPVASPTPAAASTAALSSPTPQPMQTA